MQLMQIPQLIGVVRTVPPVLFCPVLHGMRGLMFAIRSTDLLFRARSSISRSVPLVKQARVLGFLCCDESRSKPITYQKTIRLSSQFQDHGTEDWESEALYSNKSTKVMTVRVPSLRADLILKAGLGIARNKIELAFYESRIRINGEKVLKKSVQVYDGDELDIVRGISPLNTDFLVVSRVEVITTKGNSSGNDDDSEEEDDRYTVKIRRSKALTIENYSSPWKQVQ